MSSRKSNPGTYRVFLTRHFIDVMWLDINEDSPLKARNKAEKLANQLRGREASRAVATDNNWHADEPVKVARPGSYASGTHAMVELDEGVFIR
jgi:hypothetical protein